jgi:hypothetical protein
MPPISLDSTRIRMGKFGREAERMNGGLRRNLTLDPACRLAYGGFLPTVDGVTLTDTITNLWLSGKFSKVPFIGGYVTDEASIGTSTAPAVLNATSLGYYNFSQEQSDKVVSFYPVNSSYSDPSGTGNFQLSPLEVTRQAAAAFGEGGISGSERLTNRAMCDHGACDTTWGFRFDAPTVGTKYYDETVPLAPVVHSADNSYLQVSGFDRSLMFKVQLAETHHPFSSPERHFGDATV